MPEMKKSLLIVILFSIVLLSCKKETTAENESVVSDSIPAEHPEIIVDSITNKDGVTLKMQFNNTAETALLELNGEKIELKQQRMASGIKYTNTIYEFTEHQGKIMLTKAGQVVYTYED